MVEPFDPLEINAGRKVKALLTNKAPSKFRLGFKGFGAPPILINFVLAKETLHRVANSEY